MDDNNRYPEALRIDWAFEMDVVINMKQWKMTFERKALMVIVPLEPAEGAQYIEPVYDYEEDDDLNQNYKITPHDEYQINPTIDGQITQDREKSCTSDSNEELKHWQNRLHEVSTLCCNMMVKSLQWVSTKVRKNFHYDGLNNVNIFLDEFEREVPEEHRFLALELALHPMLTRWLGMHKEIFVDWKEYNWMMNLRFGNLNNQMTINYCINDDQCDIWCSTKKYGEKNQSQNGCISSVAPQILFP